jgi:hypothetical protein
VHDKVVAAVAAAVAAVGGPEEQVLAAGFAVVGPDVAPPEPTGREAAGNVARLAAGVALGALTGITVLSQRHTRVPEAGRFVVVTNMRLLLFDFKGFAHTVPRRLVAECGLRAVRSIRTNAELTAAVLGIAGLDVGLAIRFVVTPADGPPVIRLLYQVVLANADADRA